jgi:hypothetical protein
MASDIDYREDFEEIILFVYGTWLAALLIGAYILDYEILFYSFKICPLCQHLICLST